MGRGQLDKHLEVIIATGIQNHASKKHSFGHEKRELRKVCGYENTAATLPL